MSEETLFDMLGGPAGVAQIVHEMYSRVLADPELAPFFERVEMERLRRMQYQFIASALDGPVNYSGGELSAIHKGRGITGHHFAKFCGHFADALEAHGASSFEVNQALGRLSTYKDKITGETNIDG
jgi:hemoglobin